MKKDTLGNLIFTRVQRVKNKQIIETYIWTKKNYEEHELRHSISSTKALHEIEQTIQLPDVVTVGPNAKQKSLYRVLTYQDSRNCRAVRVWRVICYIRGKYHYIIATEFEDWTSSENVIHYLEKVVWKKSGSLI
ncbi:MAG: hypothetical protein V1738_04870 [Patescibacteria group bacterium]